MGGDYYDRDVVSTSSSSGYSAEASKVIGKVNSLHFSLDPKKYKEKNLIGQHRNPIVFALDVTGSMGDWSKIIYDKMPMFYGQIMMQNYLQDPGLSFCAVGDYTCDEAPLQITEFGQGKEIDQLISKIYLEGGGGGGYTESYETAAYFYSDYVEMHNAEMSFFFITGDEAFYDKIPAEVIMKVTGRDRNLNDINSKEAWQKLMKTYNVFFIKKPYHNEKNDIIIKKLWVETIGEERVLEIVTPKACIDVILGAIALTSGRRNLDGYIKDMENRGQDRGRLDEVTKALTLYAKKLSSYEIIPVKPAISSFNYSNNYGYDNSSSSYNNNFNNKSNVGISDVKEVVNKLHGTENMTNENKKYLESLKEMKRVFKDSIPAELLCPITEEIFFDPVMTCDGQTYERKAIEYWLQNHDTSPVTNLKLDSKNLIPNFVIKKIVKEYFDKKNSFDR